MSSSLLFVTLLAQSQFQDAFPAHIPSAAADLQQAPGFGQPSDQESAQKTDTCQQHRFTTSLNHLKKALDELANAYNQGKLDVKKIEEIKKAWRDLETDEVRFRLETVSSLRPRRPAGLTRRAAAPILRETLQLCDTLARLPPSRLCPQHHQQTRLESVSDRHLIRARRHEVCAAER